MSNMVGRIDVGHKIIVQKYNAFFCYRLGIQLKGPIINTGFLILCLNCLGAGFHFYANDHSPMKKVTASCSK